MSKIHKLEGQRFGRLVAIGRNCHKYRGQIIWNCVCDCGATVATPSYNLTSGRTVSCGCYGRSVLGERSRLHGRTGTAEYAAWKKMRQRCCNKSDPKYPDYGGRGIKICGRWQRFDAFLADMGKRPSSKHSIGRINNDGDYEPSNCKWSIAIEQANNTRRNRLMTANGATHSLAEWARRLGVATTTITRRIQRGWSTEEALQ